MPRRSRTDWAAVTGAAVHHVLSLRDLAELGVSRQTIAGRCRPDGAWQRLLPGVVMMQSGTPTFDQRIDAALRYGGPDAVLTGATAAALYGLRRVPAGSAVHVLVPAQRRRASRDWVLIERTTRLPVVAKRRGFPVAPVARAVLDCARRMSDRDNARALIAEAVQRGIVATKSLVAELEDGSDRGSALPRRVLAEISDGVRSAAEGWARDLAHVSGLPDPRWNVAVFDADRQFLGRPDGWFDEVAMAWQIDSYEFHLSPKSYATTLERHAAMTSAGIVVLHTLPTRLRSEPAAVLEELRKTYRVAQQRPRPRLFVDP